MISKLYPVQYLGSHNKKSDANVGFTNPQLFEMNDGNKYLVKFKNNPQGTRVLVNEFVVGRLAQLLGLPVIPFEIVRFSDNDFKRFPELQKYGFQAGNQFASYYIKNCIGFWEPQRNGRIVNLNQAPGIIVFDYWVNNKDRDFGNALLEVLPNNSYYLHLIDHGYCFPGYTWTVKKLETISLKLLNQDVHEWAASRIADPRELLAFIKKIISISDDQIYQILLSIPEDWDVTSEEKEALFKYLLKAKIALPILVAKVMKKYFQGG